nr:hypothetical protein [uncultured Romboutsia sp.]
MIKINKVEYLKDKAIVNFNLGQFKDCKIEIDAKGYLREDFILDTIKEEIEYLYENEC